MTIELKLQLKFVHHKTQAKDLPINIIRISSSTRNFSGPFVQLRNFNLRRVTGFYVASSKSVSRNDKICHYYILLKYSNDLNQRTKPASRWEASTGLVVTS